MTPQEVVLQRRTALDKANHIRSSNADFKKSCASSSTVDAIRLVSDALRSPDAGTLEAMKIRHILECIPRLGSVRAITFLRAAMITNSDRPLRTVPPRQRQVLAHQIDVMAERWTERWR
jgi:hypothetical protein